MGTTARTVTPRIDVGDFTHVPHVKCADPDEAARIILAGGPVVLLPDDNTARATLRILGASERMIEERILFSHTGRVRGAV